jgi:hypothetical protein
MIFIVALIRAQVPLRYGLKTFVVTIVVQMTDIIAIQMVLE